MWRRLPQEWAQSSVKPTYEAWVAVSQDLLPPGGEGSTCPGSLSAETPGRNLVEQSSRKHSLSRPFPARSPWPQVWSLDAFVGSFV